MGNYTFALDQICRFCLCNNSLVSFTEVTGSVLSARNVLYYTGIELTEHDEGFVLCKKCSTTITDAVGFRLACLRNDSIFKRLVGWGKPDARLNDTMGRTFEYWTGCGTTTVLSPDLNASENDVISLDDSESDDESSVGENLVSVERNNSTHDEDKESNIGQTITDDETDAEALDGNESDASMPALHGEVVEKASNDKLIAKTEDEKKSNCSTKDSAKSEQITERDSSQSYKDTSTNWSKKNRLLSDGSDSDNSVTSLYGEWMEKISNKFIPDSFIKVVPRKIHDYHAGLCPYCGVVDKRLGAHIQRTHEAEKKLPCPHCPMKFAEKTQVKNHINTWHEKRIIRTCPICGKGFVNDRSYRYHKYNSHGKSDVYECQICNRKFKSQDGYRRHFKNHSLTSPRCNDCGKVYSTAYYLERHKLSSHHT